MRTMRYALGPVTLALVIVWARPSPAAAFIRGDADGNGPALNVTDAIQILSYLFLGQPGSVPDCLDAGDGDDSGALELTDAIYILRYLFLSDSPPPAPFPDCGDDPTEDSLDCEVHAPCASTEESLGKIAFTPDDAARVSAVLNGDTTELSVTDASGVRWDLSIPDQLHAEGCEVSMIPLKDVRQIESGPPVLTGILFEPEGLQFAEPATLTATFPPGFCEGNVMIYMIGADASIDFTPASVADGVGSFPILHFSGYCAGDSAGYESPLCKYAKDQIEKAKKQAKEILSEPVDYPRGLPPLDMKCKDLSPQDRERVDSYKSSFMKKELEVIQALDYAKVQYEMLKCVGTVEWGSEELKALVARLLVKARMLITDNYEKPDNAYTVYTAVWAVWNVAYEFGVEDQALSKALYDYLYHARDQIWDRFHNSHDYGAKDIARRISELCKLACTDAFCKRYEDSCRFKVEIEMEFTVGSVLSFYVKGEATAEQKCCGTNTKTTGEGKMEYLEAVKHTGCVVGEQSQLCDDVLESPTEFPFKVVDVDVDRCSNQVSLYFQANCVPTTWTWCHDENQRCNTMPHMPDETNVCTNLIAGCWVNGMISGDAFMLPMQLNDKQAKVASREFNMDVAQAQVGFLKATVTHVPK